MRGVIIVPNPKKDISLAVTERVVRKLISLDIKVYADASYALLSDMGAVIYTVVPKDVDAVVVIGGDGSMIDASGIAIALDVPLLGVNLGRVGYLDAVDFDKLDLLDMLKQSKLKIEEKLLLSASKIGKDGKVVSCDRKAVNDVVISHDNYFGISDFIVENESGDKLEYRADGIILATPVGSTAYSLSAGGPIISHGLDSIAVTPICPHSFFNRTVIYGADEEIVITNIGDNSLNISVDGRYFDSIATGESCAVYKSAKRLKMLALTENNMFSVLFDKINVLKNKI